MDAPTAKSAARNLKRRLEALGHVISLNHAYEGVAAMCGYPTWAVMKARLEMEPSSDPVVIEKPFPEGGIPWQQFSSSRHNPTSLFFGPDDARRQAILDAIAIAFIEEQRAMPAQTPSLKPFLRAIMVTSGSPCLSMVERKLATDREAFSRVGISKDSCDLSIFDLPLGRKYPRSGHRSRIIDFLTALVRPGIEGNISDDQAVAEPIPRLVDALYTARDREPRMYEAGIFPEIDALLFRRVEDIGGMTWWDVSAKLADLYLTDLAQWAMAQAVPSLSDCMPLLGDIDRQGVMSNGERAVHVIGRGISSALRAYPFLRNVRRPGERHSKAAVIEIADEADDGRVADLLFLTAENDYRMLVESIWADDDVRAVYKANRSPIHTDPMRLMISMRGTSSVVYGRAAGLMNDAVKNDREVIVFSDHLDACRSFIPRSSSYMVYGVQDHADVPEVGKIFDLEMDYTNLVHDHMVGVRGVAASSVPMVASRRKFHMTEKSAIMWPVMRQ